MWSGSRTRASNVCPVCHQVIVPGGIHENAERPVATEMGGALGEKGIDYPDAPGEAHAPQRAHLSLSGAAGGQFFRGAARERRLPRPSLSKRTGLAKVFVFDETQQALSENIFRFFTFLRRGGKWITAGELAREGVRKAVDFFAEDLEPLVRQRQGRRHEDILCHGPDRRLVREARPGGFRAGRPCTAMTRRP